MTRRLTPGSNGYTNPNTNPTRSSRHLTLPKGDHRGEITEGRSPGEITGAVHREEITRRNHQLHCSI